MKSKFLSRLRLRQISGIVISLALLALNYTAPLRALRTLSDEIHIQPGEQYALPITNSMLFTVSSQNDAVEVSLQRGESISGILGHKSDITISLFGVIPVKSVSVSVRNDITLMPGGSSIGVTLHTRGALVVGISNVVLSNGDVISPAASAGIQAGDLIESANGVQIQNAAHLAQLCNESKEHVELGVLRGNNRFSVTLHPALDPADNQYRMGMWVRDSTAGVGTLSFYHPHSGWYGALGHAITDIDTRASLTVRDGEIVESNIVDIVQGAQGEPGEIRGTFNSNSKPLGTIEVNGPYGIYGRMYAPYVNPLYPDGLPMAYPEEVSVGPAQLLTTLSDDGVKAYDCQIIKVNPQSAPAQKGMVLEVTDPKLLAATGGIVQGMSGSPIVQNGKLIGVVTHVFINDPTKGYCMYAQWMQQQIA